MADPDIHSSSGYFRARWRGAVSLPWLFWIDMVVVGTAVNLTTSFAALVVLGLKWPLWASIAVYLSPLPYNTFLVLAVWRTADRTDPSTAAIVRTGALGWLVIATLI